MTSKIDVSETWTDEDYRDFSDASFALIEQRVNEKTDADAYDSRRITSVSEKQNGINYNPQTTES